MSITLDVPGRVGVPGNPTNHNRRQAREGMVEIPWPAVLRRQLGLPQQWHACSLSSSALYPLAGQQVSPFDFDAREIVLTASRS
jgi:hypothetical protein